MHVVWWCFPFLWSFMKLSWMDMIAWRMDRWTDRWTDRQPRQTQYVSIPVRGRHNDSEYRISIHEFNLAYSCDHLALSYTYSNNTHSSKKHLPSFPSCTHAHTQTCRERETERERERERERVSERDRDRERQRLRQRQRESFWIYYF